MQNTKLIGPVANYIAASNTQDIEAAVAIFSEHAVVRDEGQRWQGIAAIRQWAVEVSTKYRPIFETLEVAQDDDRTILTGRVVGSFPGSPVDLCYAFTLNGGKIERLEIS
jgi:hypothetical protein